MRLRRGVNLIVGDRDRLPDQAFPASYPSKLISKSLESDRGGSSARSVPAHAVNNDEESTRGIGK